MTVTTNAATTGEGAVEKSNLVTLTIDGFEVSVPRHTLIIRAAELLGIQIPRFCDHPLLDPVGACRQCLVEIPDAGNGRPMPKPQAACTTEVAPGMVVRTQLTSAVADKAQQGIMEFLLVNHPLDCPMCDKGGECPLQNQAMTNGRPEARFYGVKRTFPKPIAISAQVLLDRERCVLCARCTRFSAEIAGDPFIELLERGSLQQVGIYEKEPFESYFSGNTIQICPVGALTSTAYRFRARPFDLVSVPSVAEHDACGSAIRVDHRRNKVMRRLAGDDPEVNEEWITDKDRFAFAYTDLDDRLTHPMVRDEVTGELVVASWPDALNTAARGLLSARSGKGAAVLTGGRLTVEDAYAYSKFARIALRTNDIDFRARDHSAEEADFLAAVVAGTGPGDEAAVTYADLEKAAVVLLVGLEVEEDAGVVFLRLRKGVRKHGTVVYSVAPFVTGGLAKLSGRLISAAPGTEAEILDAIVSGDSRMAEVGEALRGDGAIILVGERLAGVPGALSSAVALASATGARLAWIPRRAGERGAVEAGALPNLLPGGRPIEDPAARVDVGAAWGVELLPTLTGRDTTAILAAAENGELDALVVAGVEIDDLPDPRAAVRALAAVPFLVSVEVRRSAVTDLADVVFPVAPVVEKAGTFVNWEGRYRPFGRVLGHTNAMPDQRILALVADEMDIPLRLPTVEAARAELAELGVWDGTRPTPPSVPAREPASPNNGQAVLATWRLMLDNGRLQDGEPYLAATARRPVARVSAATAQEVGVKNGEPLRLSTSHGAIKLPVVITDMPDHVVWVPANSPGSRVNRDLVVAAGAVVTLSNGSSA
jgi:NADH-quinone oxidoreductase subunit G